MIRSFRPVVFVCLLYTCVGSFAWSPISNHGTTKKCRMRSHKNEFPTPRLPFLEKPTIPMCTILRMGMVDDARIDSRRFLQDLYELGRSFRIVVLANGAIMENTVTLGPIYTSMRSSTSPKTGEEIVTFASLPDSSFEFHVKVDQLSKVTFSETERSFEDGSKKTMRIIRFINHDSQHLCSLILNESTQEAISGFRQLEARYS